VTVAKVWLLIAMLMVGGCAGSLEVSRAQARLERIGPVALMAEAPRPPECAGIDSRRQVWSGVLWSGLGLTAASAAVATVVETKGESLSDKEQTGWAIGLGVTGGAGLVGSGVGKVELDLADSEWAARCGQ
jgi:hypothetical protein